jgi:enolase
LNDPTFEVRQEDGTTIRKSSNKVKPVFIEGEHQENFQRFIDGESLPDNKLFGVLDCDIEEFVGLVVDEKICTFTKKQELVKELLNQEAKKHEESDEEMEEFDWFENKVEIGHLVRQNIQEIL